MRALSILKKVLSILFSLLLSMQLNIVHAQNSREGNMSDNVHVPVAAPIGTDSAGRGGDIAIHSVVRVICPQQNSVGSGFLHKSGSIITAEHVVRGCTSPIIVFSNQLHIQGTVIAQQDLYDLALIRLSSPVAAPSLSLFSGQNLSIGTQVSAWGYPVGYQGALPMLSVGYLSGIDRRQISTGEVVNEWVVNAAFNSGNSGGPLLHIESGQVIGVVSSKVAPISAQAADILRVLPQQNSGFMYTATRPDGTTFQMSEGQLVGIVLNELRSQIQLVIGKATLHENLASFLRANKIDP